MCATLGRCSFTQIALCPPSAQSPTEGSFESTPVRNPDGVYTSPINATSTYCNPGQTSAYCLLVDNGSPGHWGITCTDGTAFGKRCGGCNTGPGYITCY
jgi:hypothetical protein